MKNTAVEVFLLLAADVLNKKRIKMMKEFVQHGNTSCYEHSVAVAYYCLYLDMRFDIGCSRKELVRGALLHDYFLYDWHEKDPGHRLHGFSHPKTAYKNAKADFNITVKEGEIIRKHMFPLVPLPPVCRESILVSLVDKYCSVLETFFSAPYLNAPFAAV